MNSNKTNKLKLLIVGAFVAFSQLTTFGQSITAEHYEASGTQTYLFPAPFFASNVRICAQDSVKLTAASFSGSTFTWTLADGSTSAITTSSIWVKDQGNYSVSDGTSSATLYVNKEAGKPEIYSSSYPVTEELLRAAGLDSNRTNPGTLFSFFSSTSKQNYIAPVGKEYTYNKQQYLITSSELTAMGFAQGSTLKSLGFYFNESWSGCNSNGYNLRIQLYPATLTAMSGSFITSGGQYLGDYSCDSHDQGWNYFDFGNNYTWDGTSDLVFDFSYYNENGSTNNPSIAIDQTSFDATTISISPNVDLRYNWPSSAAFVKSAGNYRPSLSFKYSRAALKDTIVSCASSIQLDIQNGSGSNTYTWASTGGLSSSTSNLSVSSSDLVYLSSVSSNLCLVQDTVQVLESSVTQPTITASSTDFCEGETVTLSTTIPADHTASWSDASSSSSITVIEGGGYTVAFINQYGCSKTSAEKVITEIKKPVLLKSANFVDVYSNEEHTLEKTTGTYGTKNVKYFGDFGGKKYFINKDGADSASYADFIESNTGAEHVVIDNQALDQWMTTTHKELYDLSSNDYPYTLQTGVKWDESEQELRGIDGTVQTYESFWGNPVNDLSSDKWFMRYHQNGTFLYWWEADYFDYGGFLISYSIADLTVQNGDVYCDSVELFAPADFDTFLWSSGETSSSIWVSGTGSNSVSLTGTYTKSDGTTCSLTSDTYTFAINPSPTLTITNESGTEDLNGTNTIELEATYASGSTISWSTGASADSIFVTSAGEYTATVDLNGCTTIKTANIYEPIFVDDDGSDITGTGTLASPYETLSKGLTEVTSGGKVYVLPGTYQETVNITKNVFIASDYYRLQDSAALHSTIIDGEGQRRLVNYDNTTENLDSSKSKIVGFTMTGGFEENDEGAGIYGGWNVSGTTQIKNCLIEDISRKCCASGIVLGWMSNAHLIMDSVFVKDIGQANYGDQRRAFYINNGQLTLRNSVVENTEHDKSLFNLPNSAVLNLENVRITDVHENYQDYGAVFYLDGSSKAYLNHVTIDNIYLDSRYIARILSNNVTFHVVNSVVDDAKGRFIWDQSSGVAEIEIHNSVIGNGESGYAGSYLSSLPGVGQDGSLADNSEAIGYANSNVLIGSKKFTSPLKDVTGTVRPAPLGSAPDAGAYESDKAQGDFDVLLAQCGYLLEAIVLNSTNYTYSWSLNGSVVSTDLSYLATALGTYTFEVVSTDRSQTISEDIILSDPLTYDLVYANNNCSVLSGDNGEILWGGATGGDRNTVDSWEYRTGIKNENGTQYDGAWYIDEDTWYNTRSSMPTGKYYVYIEDNSGCIVGDTVEIADQARDTYYVSTTGSNSNTGTSSTDAFASIATAVDFACTNDTIILLDGTYYEDSLEIKKNLIIGSQYLFDDDINHIAATIIDGQNDGWILSWEAGTSGWSDTATNQLVGLTIQNGNSTNSDYAGGVKVQYSRALALDHVNLINNVNNQNQGGGLWTRNNSYVSLKNVIFDGNSSSQEGSGWYSYYSYVYGRDLTFKNHTNRGPIRISSSRSFDVANVLVEDNVSNDNIMSINMYDLESDAQLSNWTVRGNTANSWMIRIDDGSRNGKKSYYNNWLVVDNTTTGAHPGINFSNTSGTYVFSNLTVWNNITGSSTSNEYNAQIWHQYSNQTTEMIFMNSIIGSSNGWGITSEDWNANTTISVDYTTIEGGASKTDGGTNTTISLGSSNVLSSSPYFTDAANGDYSLSNVSTLLGAGASSATVGGISITAPTTDLYGNPRPNPAGTTPDIGAIESPESAPQVGIAAVTTDNGFCQTTSGAITANLLNYTGTATYSWSSSTYPTWTWNATQSATGLSSGDYKVVAIDATSGAKIDSTEITIATLPSISITNTSTDVTCFGDDDGELTFEIYGGNPLGGSQYTYSVDYLQTMAQATGVVLGSSYFDQDNNSNARTNKYNADNYNGNPIYQGKYYVSVSDQNSCTFTDTVEVGYQNALPVVNITTLASDGTVGLTSMCEGTGNVINLTANVTGGGGTNTFSWSNASTAQTVGVAQTGDYIIEVTDNNTCVGKDTMSIYFQSAPQLVRSSLDPNAGVIDFELTDSYGDSWNGALVQIINSNSTVLHTLGSDFYSGNSLVKSLTLPAGTYSVVVSSAGSYPNEIGLNVSSNSTLLSSYANTSSTSLGTVMSTFSLGGSPVVFNETFCDSVTMEAQQIVSTNSYGFTEFYWTDGSGDTINETQYKTFFTDSDVILYGVFTRSDGQTCVMSSSQYSFVVNSTPNLLITALDSTYDYSGDTLRFLASTDSLAAVVAWDHSSTLDTLLVNSVGTWSATASMDGCSVTKSITIEEPIYVAKFGSNTTGTGSLSQPYKTIQFAIDTADSGQKIYVLPGTYAENVVVDKQIRLYSDVVRLGNENATSTTIVNGGFTGRVVEFSSTSARFDKDSTILDGFTFKNGDTGGNEGSGLYASYISGTGVTIRNSVISNNRKQCCNSGIAIRFNGVGLDLYNVDILNNGSPTYGDERTIVYLSNSDGQWENVRFRGNEANNELVLLENSDVEIQNSDFIGNTIQDYDQSLIKLHYGSNLVLNHVTMTGNSGQGYGIDFNQNYDQKLIVYNSIIDGFDLGSIRTSGSSNKVFISNSVIDNTPSDVSGNGSLSTSNTIFTDIAGIKTNGTLKSTSPAIGLGGSDTTIANVILSVPALDLAGNPRPNPMGSNPDAGSYEDTLAVGDFGMQVTSCGFNISAAVVNSTSYSVSITSSNGFAYNGPSVNVPLKGTYSVVATDLLSGESITKTVSVTNPLNIGYLSYKDACASNLGYGEIILGDFSGGERFNWPNDSYWAYSLNITDSAGNSHTQWNVPDNTGHRNNVSVQSGTYVIGLSDASGCTVYDTVSIDDVSGSKYYISTTGSDGAAGVYSDPLATIQEALNRSCDGDTIILFDGEYFENVELTNTYLPYVTIASEYIEDGLASHISNTIVNGMDEDPVFDISNHNSTTDTIVFVGFTITNGKSSNWYGGGGISMYYSNIALKNMQVSGNRSGDYGGGIGMYEGYLNLWNTVIENNIASGDGGGIRAYYMYRIDGHGSTIIQNNKSNSNGGGISYTHGHWGSTNEDFYIRGFEIVNNSADGTGGLHVSNWGNNNGTLEIDNIKVVNNRSTSYGTGGAYISNNGEDAILSNVIISSNRSNSIGGLELNDVDINIVHATVYANGVVDGTSANDQIRLQNNSNVLFLNSAVGGQQNVGTSIAHTFYLDDYDTTCDLTISNSIVSGGINSIDNPYSSNIVGTPIGQALYLVNPQQGDYMLSSVSQGLGAGTSSYTGVTMPMIDIEGGLRPNPTGSDPDVGAVESPLDSATFGAAYEIRSNIACDPTYGRLKVIPLNGSGSYKYELDDLTGSATFTDQTNVSSYTYSSLYSGNYLVTITDLSSSDEFTDTVTISGKDSLTLNLVYNDIFCAGEANGAIAAIVSGGDGYYDYTWSTISNSNWPKSNKLNNLNPDEYYITVKDGDNCFAEDSVTLSTLHSLPLVAITGNIDKGGITTQTTNPQVRACAGDIVTLDAGAGYVSYNWTTIDQLNSWSTQTLSASYEEGFYVTVIDSFGCTNTDTAEVFYVQSPAIFASNVNTNIGGTYQQVTSYIEGTNQSTGLNSEPKPYGANERFAKMQFIIPANELIAEGLTDQTAINSLGFEVDIASGSAVQNFKIKVKNTTSNQVGYTFESGLTQVYDFNVLTAGDGWNTHEFDQGFVWDGTKNLLVQVEYSNVAFTSGMASYLVGHETSYNSSSVATNSSSSVANQTSANDVWSWRPNMKFGIDKVQATDTLRVCDFTMLNTTDDYDTYSWLVAGSSQGTQLRYSMGSPNEVVLKTVDAASSCTMYSDTVQVLLDTTPSVFVTSPVLAGCIGDSVIAAVDTVQSGLTYNWSNGISDTLATFTESGSYYVYAVSPSGCEGVDTVDVSINIPPDVVIELNGRVLTSTDGNLVADNSSCDTTLILPYYSAVDTLSALNNSEWSTYSNNFLEWEYQQGWDSLQDYTGPNYDADSNYFGGFYQFDPASLTDQNKVGYLQLGCINLLGMTNPELSFEYHMVDVYADSSNTSDQMGDLALQLKAAGDADWNTVWQRSGTDSTYDWASKSVALDGYVNQTVQVRWKATAGVGGPRSEIGLDNILVSDSLAALSNVSGRITAETVCEGDSLYAQAVSNGTTSFGYLWSTGDTTSAISLQTTGWYAVSVMDEENCTVQTDSVFIEVNPAPNNLLVVSDTTQYCAGTFDSLIIAAAAGYDQYEWYFKQASAPSPTPQSCSFDIVLTDSYGDGWNGAIAQLKDTAGTVLQTLGTGFTAGSSYIETVTLTSGETYTIEVSAIGTYVSEIGLEVMKDTVMIGSYQNTSSTGLGTVMSTFTANCSATVTNDAGGYAIIDSVNTVTVDSIITGSNSYYVTITDSIGCKATSETVDLIQRDIPSLVMTSAPVLCNNDSTGQAVVQVSGSGGFTFEWSNNQDSNVIDNITDGWYSVTVTDSFSCSTIDSVLVVEPSEVSLTAVDFSDVNCFGGNDGFATYTFTGGVGNYQYSWTDSSGVWSSDSLNLTNASAGMYFLNAADSNGCLVLDTVSIGEPPVLALTIDSTSDLTCYQNADGYLSATVTGGFGSYNYYIDGVAAVSLTIDSLDAGSHVVSVIDDNGCSDSVSFALTEPVLLTASTSVVQYLGGIQVSCIGATDGAIDVFVNGGTLPYNYLWADGDTTEDRSNIGAGSYSMTVTDEQGCTVSVNELISEPSALVATSLVDSLDCYGASDGSIAYTLSGATAPYITSWSSNTGSSADSVLATFQVNMNGASINTGGIELITNSGQNYNMNLVPVLEDSIYRVTISVAVGSTLEYRFFNGSTAETVSSSCGVNVGGTIYRSVTVGSDTTLVAIEFSGCTTTGSAYSGALTGSTRSLTGLSAGSYELTISDVNGCNTILIDSLIEPDSIQISAIVYDASCPQTPDGFIDVTATGGSGSLMYNWSTTDTTEDLTAAYGYYTVTVTDANGCIDSATYLVDAPFPYNDEELCVVTVDTTGVNLVVWEKTPSQRTADYVILRENAATQYVSVGNNTYLNMSTWADQNSNPAVQPYRYKLVLQDSCGNYSDTSDYHATIHLQASQGVAQNEVNLQWTAYEGKQVQTYYIYRWLSPINRVLVDSVSSNVYTYTDIYPVTTTITALLYEVGAKFVNGGCSPSTGKQSSYANSMSNVLDWGQDGGLPIGTEEWVDVVLGNDLDIYPNPTRGALNLELKGAWEEQEDIQIKITDMTGRILAYRITQGAGTVRFDFEELPAGIYFLNIITGEGRTIVKRFERVN